VRAAGTETPSRQRRGIASAAPSLPLSPLLFLFSLLSANVFLSNLNHDGLHSRKLTIHSILFRFYSLNERSGCNEYCQPHDMYFGIDI
jgi:hypothetical protein